MMKLIKWTVIFAFSFFVSSVVIMTLVQDEFSSRVPARIIRYTTPEFPLYAYVAGAFAVGIFIGLAVALYNFISLKAASMKKGGRIRQLEAEVANLKTRLETAEERVRASDESENSMSAERLMDDNEESADNDRRSGQTDTDDD